VPKTPSETTGLCKPPPIQVITGAWSPGGADHPSASKNIWKMDLKGQNVKSITGLRIDQHRAVRARFPNGCTSDQPLPSGYMCQGNMTNGRVVDPNDGFGSNLLTEWIKPTAPGMNQSGWTELNPDTPFRDTGLSFQKFQLGIGGTCGNDTMSGGVGFVPPAGYWCGNACEGGAPKPPGCISRWPRGLMYNSSVLPNAPYKNPTTGVVQVWHPGECLAHAGVCVCVCVLARWGRGGVANVPPSPRRGTEVMVSGTRWCKRHAC
jgi:hypothetical protein